MIKIFKTLGILFCLVLLYLSLTERKLVLAFVNATEQEKIKIEYSIDGEPSENLILEQSPIPNEFILRKVNFGFHQLVVKSEDCDVHQTVSFFNFLRYEINLEFQETNEHACETQIRKSAFGLIYQ